MPKFFIISSTFDLQFCTGHFLLGYPEGGSGESITSVNENYQATWEYLPSAFLQSFSKIVRAFDSRQMPLDCAEFTYGDLVLLADQEVLSLQLSIICYWLYTRTLDWVLETQLSFS